MSDWASQVTGTAPAEPKDWSKELNQALSSRESQAQSPTMPFGPPAGMQRVPRDGRYVDVPEPKRSEGTNFGAAFKENFVEDPETKRRLVAESLFPGDPSGITRVGFADGEPVYIDDAGELRYVSSRSGRFAGAAVANTPEIIGATIGSFAQGNPVSGSATGAAGGRALKRGISQLVFDEPATPASVGKEMLTEAAIDAAGGVIAKGATKLADRGKTVDFAPQDMQAAEATRRQVKDTTGVDIDLAQASGDRKLIAMRQYGARFPGKSADDYQKFDEQAQAQFEKRTGEVLDSIARAKPSETYGKEGGNAARKAIDDAIKQRDTAVAPYYDQARSVRLSADVVEEIGKDPLIARASRRVAADPVYQRNLKGLPPDSVGYWHQVKRNLDASFQKAERAGNKVAMREYGDAAAQLNKKLGSASHEYAQANEFFAKSTREIVSPLEESVVGIIARVENQKAATISARIFQDPNVTTDQIRYARATIERQDPEAWNGLVRQWLGQKWNAALKETQTGDVVNPAGKFRQAVFGTPQDRAKAVAMLPGDSATIFHDLMRAAERLASTPIAGSNTMRDTEIKDQLKGQGAVVFRWLTSPRASFQNAAEQRALEQGTEAITQALLDPTKRSQLKRIVRMAPSTKQAILISTIIGGKATAVAAEGVDDQAPPSLGR